LSVLVWPIPTTLYNRRKKKRVMIFCMPEVM
jgi:hypothetical protein